MRITLFTDFRFANDPAPTGVLKHALFMAKGLARRPDCEVSALVSADQVGQQGCLSFLPGKKLPLPWKVARELWTWTSRPVVDRWIGEADWVYCPKNDWIPVKRAKYAVTIHGAHELDPAFVVPRGLKEQALCYRTRRQYLKMCEQADVVLTVSEWLKAFIVEQFHTDASKIVVVGNGVDECFYEAGRRKVLKCESSKVLEFRELGITTRDSKSDTHARMNECTNELLPYILCVGGLNTIDGGDRIIALGQEIKRSGKRIRIKVAGCQHDPGAQQLAAETGVIDLLGYVPHEQLAEWMSNAAVFYFPTRYETFGMAAAEAMAVGCPVVTSRCTAVPEIVGDCGVYVNPDDPGQVLNGVLDAVQRGGGIQNCVEKGSVRAQRYSWNKCVHRLDQVLSS